MLLFIGREIAQSFGEHDIFANVEFDIEMGEKVAIVGPNGVGKSSLLRIIAGVDSPAAGGITFFRNVDIHLQEQRPSFLPGATVYDILEQAAYSHPHLPRQGREASRGGLSAGVGAMGEDQGSGLGRRSEGRGEEQSEGRRKECSEERSRVSEAASRFGFVGREADLAVDLSGGEKTRLQLACTWLRHAGLLLLDEPTNHLDVDHLDWLETFIRAYMGTVILVSHDRYFLDRTVDRILELRPDGISSYPGNYTAYQAAKQQKFERDMKTFTEQEKEARKLQRAIDEQARWAAIGNRDARKKAIESGNKYGGKEFRRAKAEKLARRSKNTIKRLERLRKRGIARPQEDPEIDLSFIAVRKGGRCLLYGEGIHKSYGRLRLLEGAAFALQPREKVALTGPNGSGKTTLLRLILGIEPLDEGRLWRSPSLRCGYLAQELESLYTSRTVADEMAIVTTDKVRARSLLANLLISADDMRKECRVLSMGERVRVAVAKLLLGAYDLLILDEPANHLDLQCREKLEEALKEYEGALLLVSHDRYMLDSVCQTVWSLRDRRILRYPGRYSEYMEHLEDEGRGFSLSPDEMRTRVAIITGKLAILDKRSHPEEYAALEAEFFSLARILRGVKA